MKELNKWQSIIYMVGGGIMTLGAIGFAVVLWNIDIRRVCSWVYLVGAVMFTVMQTMQSYEGRNFVVRRLKRIQGIASLLFIIAGFLMIDNMWFVTRPFFNNDIDYLNTMANKWVLALLIGAILEMYTATRISMELKKEKQTEDDGK
ncbi:MAG: hypothetical protein ACOYJG_06535 [Prevotella sp.]|jgi:hypothetical protein